MRELRRAGAAAATLAVVATLIAARPLAPARAASQTHTVVVDDIFFSPPEVRIAPGDTVVWRVAGDGHTVTASDQRFNFYPHRLLHRGDTVSWTFLAEETVLFYCRVHGDFRGNGMSGRVVVGPGVGSPSPSPSPVVRRVPSEYPTIAAALNGIPAGATVALAPGTYRQRATVTTPGVTIRGEAATPDGVVIDGQGVRGSGLVLAAAGAAVENLTVAGHLDEGIALRHAAGARVERVHARGNGGFGVVVASSRQALVRDVRASGHAVAGIMVKGCAACDIVVEGVLAEGNLFGVLVDNAGEVVVRGSTVRGNATGIVVRTLATEPGALRGPVAVTDNDVAGNVAAIPAPSPTEFAVGAGIWVAGGAADLVEANRIAGNAYGVLVSSFAAPSAGVRVAGNTIDSSSKAAIAWDGIGSGVCFEANRDSAGAEPTSRPPLAQTLYPCGRPVGAGIPEPLVLADLALAAALAAAG